MSSSYSSDDSSDTDEDRLWNYEDEGDPRALTSYGEDRYLEWCMRASPVLIQAMEQVQQYRWSVAVIDQSNIVHMSIDVYPEQLGFMLEPVPHKRCHIRPPMINLRQTISKFKAADLSQLRACFYADGREALVIPMLEIMYFHMFPGKTFATQVRYPRIDGLRICPKISVIPKFDDRSNAKMRRLVDAASPVVPADRATLMAHILRDTEGTLHLISEVMFADPRARPLADYEQFVSQHQPDE